VAAPSPIPRLTDIVEAIEHIRAEMTDVPLDAFEADWRKRWLVERGVEIISEASRRLPTNLKARHPEIPWPKVAGIGNVLRHNYESVAAQVMWALVRDELAPLEKACREELAAARPNKSEQ
jgi:uncharacterized protein with HEPN domain